MSNSIKSCFCLLMNVSLFCKGTIFCRFFETTLKLYLHWKTIIGIKLCFNWQSFLAKMSVILQHDVTPTCHGFLGRCNINRSISIFVILPKVTKVSKATCHHRFYKHHCSWHFHSKTSPMYTTLKRQQLQLYLPWLLGWHVYKSHKNYSCFIKTNFERAHKCSIVFLASVQT
jgi:hypothetical protein